MMTCQENSDTELTDLDFGLRSLSPLHAFSHYSHVPTPATPQTLLSPESR